MVSRREFLKQAAIGPVVLSFHNNWLEYEPAEYPPYPSIPRNVLDEQGWSQENQTHIKKEGAKWSISTYQWDWLRSRINDATNGTIDIPLGGLVAYRVGDTASFWDRDNKFSFPDWAKSELDEHIKSDFKNYLHNFSKTGFNTIGEIDWSISPFFGTTSSILIQECMPSGTLTTESAGSTQIHQFNIEYELNEQSANMNQEVEIQTTDLEFFGWVAAWANNQHVYAVGGIHPNGTGDYCGLDNPHIEEALNEAMDEEINLGLDETLYGRMHTIMGSIE